MKNTPSKPLRVVSVVVLTARLTSLSLVVTAHIAQVTVASSGIDHTHANGVSC